MYDIAYVLISMDIVNLVRRGVGWAREAVVMHMCIRVFFLCIFPGIQLKDFVKELSRHIGNDYRKLARALGIVKTDIDSLELENPRDLKEQIAQFFIFWQRKEGRNATIEELKQALRKAELLDALEIMENFNKGINYYSV